MDIKRTKVKGILSKLFLALNLVCGALLLVSAYGGTANPASWSWLVSATLAFPFLFAANAFMMLCWLVVFSRKWLWSFGVMLACTPALRAYCPVNFSQPVPKGCLKVETYNVFAFATTDEEGFKDMLEYLRTCDADIFCAQEASCMKRYRDDVDDAMAHWRYRNDSAFGGLMICSDYPIVGSKVIGSPSATHACVVYLVRVENDTVAVVNSHFVSNAMSVKDKEAYRDIILSPEEDSVKDDALRLCRKVNKAGVDRAVQADSLADYLETLGDVPVIVCGDFNDSPLSYVHHRLTRKLHDAYVASGNGPGISYHRSGMFFRLDNILCSHHWRSFGAVVKKQLKMSDHYPVSACLKRVE
jgi:endonuclease/exonuclease/phosphatase family metal-dependent hydrolase